jgi:hypothetical protein
MAWRSFKTFKPFNRFAPFKTLQNNAFNVSEAKPFKPSGGPFKTFKAKGG